MSSNHQAQTFISIMTVRWAFIQFRGNGYLSLYLFLFLDKIMLYLVEIIISKMIFMPKSFNTNIAHQLLDYTLSFVNLQH